MRHGVQRDTRKLKINDKNITRRYAEGNMAKCKTQLNIQKGVVKKRARALQRNQVKELAGSSDAFRKILQARPTAIKFNSV